MSIRHAITQRLGWLLIPAMLIALPNAAFAQSDEAAVTPAIAEPIEDAAEEAAPAEPEAAPTEPATKTVASAADKRQAAEFYTQGLDLYDQGLFAAALESFRKAQDHYQSSVNVYNIAKCYEKLGTSTGCVEWFQRYLTDYASEHEGQAAPDALDVENSIEKCQLGLKSVVTIESVPSGAAIAIDDAGTILGQTPYNTKLKPGAYTVFLNEEGFQPYEQKIQVKAGEPLLLVLKLDKLDTNGTIRVDANIRGAAIFIDGRNVGLTPYTEPIKVERGSHQIVIQKDDYIEYSGQIQVGSKEVVTIQPEMTLTDPPSTWKKGAGAALLVIGAIGVGGGFAFGQFYPELYGVPNPFYEDTDEFEEVQLVEQVMIGTGAALAAVGIALLIAEAVDDSAIRDEDRVPDEDRLSERSIEILPLIAPSTDGATLGALVTF